MDIDNLPTHPLCNLDGLVRSNAITEHQRDLLVSSTEPLEDLWANPYLRSVREHSRAYIESLLFGGFGAAPRPISDRGI